MAFEKKVWLGGDTVTAAHLNRIENGIMEAMESGGSGAGEAVLPDWNENDPTSAAYIQNRPFYEAVQRIVLYENSALDFMSTTDSDPISTGGDTIADFQVELYDGMPITVTINGVSEDLILNAHDDGIRIGYSCGDPSLTHFGVTISPALSVTGNPAFQISFADFTNATTGTANVSITGDAGSVVKIPAKYIDIPDGVVVAGEGTGSTVQGLNSQADGDYSHAEGVGGRYNYDGSIFDSGAYGTADHTEGYQTTTSASNADGDQGKHAEGYRTHATGGAAHAEGSRTTASGAQSHAEGYQTIASGDRSHAEGNANRATGDASHAEGDSTMATGDASHAEGGSTMASGSQSHAEGDSTTANHKSQHVFGEYNIADPSTANAASRGTYVEIVGNGTTDNARSNARTLDWNGNEVLAGKLTVGAAPTADMDVATKKYVDDNAGGASLPTITAADNGKVMVAKNGEWVNMELFDLGSEYVILPETEYTYAKGNELPTWTVETPSILSDIGVDRINFVITFDGVDHNGQTEYDSDFGSWDIYVSDDDLVTQFHLEPNRLGYYEPVIGTHQLSVKLKVKTSYKEEYVPLSIKRGDGVYSVAEGKDTTASGDSSHAEGSYTTASGYSSHAEGDSTTASGDQSHAEGSRTTASGYSSHAEGVNTTASGNYSHAEGYNTVASGAQSHAEGTDTIANHKSQHVFGEYNRQDMASASGNARGTYLEIVGNGTSDDNRSNARLLDWDGNEYLTGSLTLGLGTDDEVTITASQLRQLFGLLEPAAPVG